MCINFVDLQYTDLLDLQALRRMNGKARASYTREEDEILLMCRIASSIIAKTVSDLNQCWVVGSWLIKRYLQKISRSRYFQIYAYGSPNLQNHLL